MKKLPEIMWELKRAVFAETLCTLRVLELIADVDSSRVFLRYGYSSLYQYLTEGLRYSEGAANRRIRAARLFNKERRRVKKLFRERKVSLCTLSLILDYPEMLDSISGKSKRETEELLAVKRGSASRVQERIVPVVVASPSKKALKKTTATGACDLAASNGGENLPPSVASIASGLSSATGSEVILEERYKVTFSYRREVGELVQKARSVLSHKYPAGASIEELFVAGLTALLSEKSKVRASQKKKSTATSFSRIEGTSSRHIPTAIKREVFHRDKGTCTYRHRDGSVCGSLWQIEVDHIKPFSLGGKAEAQNLRLLCRKHNQMAGRDAKVMR